LPDRTHQRRVAIGREGHFALEGRLGMVIDHIGLLGQNTAVLFGID